MAGSAATVRIHGLREVQRALRKVNREASNTVRDELVKAGEPVAAAARSKLGRFQGASLSTIGPRGSVRGVFVTQRKGKVTGKRGDFGALVMTVGLLPALEENQDQVLDEVEAALDRLGRSAGF